MIRHINAMIRNNTFGAEDWELIGEETHGPLRLDKHVFCFRLGQLSASAPREWAAVDLIRRSDKY